MNTLTRFYLALVVLLGLGALPAAAKTDVTWYGHAAFKITTPSGKVILIDPWISNPLNKNAQADLDALTKVDLILISHGHSDHIGDAAAIAKKTQAKLVTSFDLGSSLGKYAGYPPEQIGYDGQGNIGGWLTLLDGEVMVMMTPAMHGSNVTGADGEIHAGGNPTGFIIKVKNGPTFYHTGDTGYFSDMNLLKKEHVNIMLCCIGDHFVMGPAAAADAVKAVGAKVVIPMHYGTFPVLTGKPEVFASEVKRTAPGTEVKVMKVGETVAY